MSTPAGTCGDSFCAWAVCGVVCSWWIMGWLFVLSPLLVNLGTHKAYSKPKSDYKNTSPPPLLVAFRRSFSVVYILIHCVKVLLFVHIWVLVLTEGYRNLPFLDVLLHISVHVTYSPVCYVQ
jgi:hypothetical protein